MVGGYVPLCGSVRRTKACLAFLKKKKSHTEGLEGNGGSKLTKVLTALSF